jgi:hypothetical protein
MIKHNLVKWQKQLKHADKETLLNLYVTSDIACTPTWLEDKNNLFS